MKGERGDLSLDWAGSTPRVVVVNPSLSEAVCKAVGLSFTRLRLFTPDPKLVDVSPHNPSESPTASFPAMNFKIYEPHIYII